MLRLQEFCQQYRQSLLVRGHASVEEVRDAWPGSEENPDLTIWGWIRCYGSLRVFLGRIQPKDVEGDRATREALVVAALSDAPEVVTLIGTDAAGEPRTMTVYPKSDVALREVHNRNRCLATLVDDAEVLRNDDSLETIELLLRVSEEQSYLQRLITWIIATPGPGLPYPERTRAPELPPELADLTTLDYYLLVEAFQKCNVLRLAALHDSKSSARRPDWAVFFASVAGELGTTTPQLMRDHSLASVLAAAAERARGHDEAMARAKVEHEKENRRTTHHAPPIHGAATARAPSHARA